MARQQERKVATEAHEKAKEWTEREIRGTERGVDQKEERLNRKQS